MKFNRDLATIHGYLCSDGYVVKNPPNQKHKYYHIGFRNTNSTLLNDFKEKAEKIFPVNARLIKDGRVLIQSKNLYFYLTKDFSYYSREWKLPKLNMNCMRLWIRAFFDCEGWVTCIKAKNRHIGAECVNKKELAKINQALKSRFRIKSTVKEKKNRDISALIIYGKENLIRFRRHIGFLHPAKKKRLDDAIDSYRSLEWEFFKIDPFKKIKIKNGKARAFSSLEINLLRLKFRLNEYGISSRIYGPIKNGNGNVYYELSVPKSNHPKLFKQANQT